VAYPGYFMNYCRETREMGMPARHRESACSGEAGGATGSTIAECGLRNGD